MPYQEPIITDEQGNETTDIGSEYIQPIMSPYQNPENIFIKHLTQIQWPEEIPEEMRDQWVHRLMFSGKEKSTAFMENIHTLKLNSLQRMNLGLMETLGLHNLLWSTIFDNIDIMKCTQGQHGNLVKAVTTKRQEFTDKTPMEQKRRLSQMRNLFLGNTNEPEQPQLQGY